MKKIVLLVGVLLTVSSVYSMDDESIKKALSKKNYDEVKLELLPKLIKEIRNSSIFYSGLYGSLSILSAVIVYKAEIPLNLSLTCAVSSIMFGVTAISCANDALNARIKSEHRLEKLKYRVDMEEQKELINQAKLSLFFESDQSNHL